MENNMHEAHIELQHRIEELEIQSALQEETIQSLSDTIARLQQTLDLQQAQLRLLYQRLPDKTDGSNEPFNPASEIPPHY
jgi:SlyX protein